MLGRRGDPSPKDYAITMAEVPLTRLATCESRGTVALFLLSGRCRESALFNSQLPDLGFERRSRNSVRGMLMTFFPTRFTVNSFMGWLGITDSPGENDARPLLDLMYLGLKHFRVPTETLRALPAAFSDDELRAMRVPVLLLFGDHERIYDPAEALARARRLLPDFQGELVPQSSHDMCYSQRRLVDRRVLDFLNDNRAPDVPSSAPPRCLDGGDVDLLHRHHRLEGTLCLSATSRKRIG